jgi:hypothetical protein
MADQVVSATMTNSDYRKDLANKIVVTIVSATGGGVSQEICAAARAKHPEYPAKLQGYILRVVTNPGATAPSDNYNLDLQDEDGVDVMGGMLSLRDATVSEQVICNPPVWIDGTLTVVGDSMGDVKETAVTIYMVPKWRSHD